MDKIESLQEVYNSEIELIIKQSSLLLQKKNDGFNGELKTSGSIVENYIKGIIKKHIPKGYRICSGYIATTDTISNTDNLIQHDLIIVDERIPAIYQFGVSDIEIVMAESVCGIIEIKRTLTRKSLKAAIKHLKETESLLKDYNGGIKSKNSSNSAAGPTLSVASHSPIYAIIGLGADKAEIDKNECGKEINQFLDMIWSLSDGFLMRFCLKKDDKNYLPLNVSRTLEKGYLPTALIHSNEEYSNGHSFRVALSVLRTWINNTSGSRIDSNLNMKYFGLM